MDSTNAKIRLPAEGELFDGKYRIGRVLGIGGMAAVLAAKHLGLDEMVALKVLLPDCCADPAVVSRFLQEGKAATKIRSEHVVRMLDVGVVSGRAYLVMEYLDGKDLEALLRKRGPLPLEEAVDLLLQACEAIGEAHALGIIHRDLKPANLFLTHRADGSPCMKVLDFGISKMPRNGHGPASTDNRPTLPSLVMGSPQFMSPEQMSSAALADQRSDIWSLGAILYELLTGEIAFSGATTAEICARVLRGSPTPLEERQPDVPREVGLIVERCLARDRLKRYATVAELARSLAPFGTSGAQASADTISRAVEGAPDFRAPLPEQCRDDQAHGGGDPRASTEGARARLRLRPRSGARARRPRGGREGGVAFRRHPPRRFGIRHRRVRDRGPDAGDDAVSSGRRARGDRPGRRPDGSDASRAGGSESGSTARRTGPRGRDDDRAPASRAQAASCRRPRDGVGRFSRGSRGRRGRSHASSGRGRRLHRRRQPVRRSLTLANVRG